MEYQSLSKLFHMSTSSSRYEDNKNLAMSRRDSDSSFSTGIVTDAGELYLAVPRELSVLNEKVLRHERTVSARMRQLPQIAQSALIRGLVIDEIFCTNDIEGVHSTRRQISDLLESVDDEDGVGVSDQQKRKRFREMAKLYLELTNKDHILPQSPEDIREVYDCIMVGEDMVGIEPDGKLFRSKGVDIIGNGSRIIHRGIEPEDRIVDVLSKMLDLVGSNEVPDIYSSIMSHYIFEYAHPFYDGNGRTGRYLLALYLSRPLSRPTALSLSRVISENRDQYYRAFKTVEDPLNHGELTFFVETMMELIRVAQDEIISNLEDKGERLDDVTMNLDEVQKDHGLSQKSADIVFQLAQHELFGLFPDVPSDEIAKHIGLKKPMTRRYTSELEEKVLIRTVSKRPLRFALTDEAKKRLGIV